MTNLREALVTGALAVVLALGGTVTAPAPALSGARIVSDEGASGAPVYRPFILTDHNGRVVSEASFLGKFQIVYFGYTHCPEICPTSLQTFTDALEILGDERAANVWVLMVSVDPERDTPEQMRQYVSNFHSQVVGLTGPMDNILAASEIYHIRFQRTEPIGGGEGDYDVDHTASAVLMAPDGRFLQRWAYGTPAQTIAADLASHMDNGD